MKRALAALLLCTTFAVFAEDHLVPLDTGILSTRSSFVAKWPKGVPDNEFDAVEFDTFPAFDGPSYLIIYQSMDAKSMDFGHRYTLYFINEGFPGTRLYKAPLPEAFAQNIESKVELIIRRTTRFDSDGRVHVPEPDGTTYLFRSNLIEAQAFSGDSGDIPGELVHMFGVLTALAKTPAGDKAKRTALLRQCQKELDAIILPDTADTAR